MDIGSEVIGPAVGEILIDTSDIALEPDVPCLQDHGIERHPGLPRQNGTKDTERRPHQDIRKPLGERGSSRTSDANSEAQPSGDLWLQDCGRFEGLIHGNKWQCEAYRGYILKYEPASYR